MTVSVKIFPANLLNMPSKDRRNIAKRKNEPQKSGDATDTIGALTLPTPIKLKSARAATEAKAGRAEWEAHDPVVPSHCQMFAQVDYTGRNSHSTNRGVIRAAL